MVDLSRGKMTENAENPHVAGRGSMAVHEISAACRGVQEAPKNPACEALVPVMRRA